MTKTRPLPKRVASNTGPCFSGPDVSEASRWGRERCQQRRTSSLPLRNVQTRCQCPLFEKNPRSPTPTSPVGLKLKKAGCPPEADLHR